MHRTTSPLYKTIYAVVSAIPSGRVMTYGQIGQLVGCTARTVGFAMAALRGESCVPWQRVINRQGKVSPRTDGEGNLLQRDLLESEGVQFDRDGRVDLELCRWHGEGEQ
ncbi:MAG TPA: MGMT family protein [Geopsychrobacteraceae bacterium]|nr:MGMT family protein [Geopsychrobacteraceae bacterium]